MDFDVTYYSLFSSLGSFFSNTLGLVADKCALIKTECMLISDLVKASDRCDMPGKARSLFFISHLLNKNNP